MAQIAEEEYMCEEEATRFRSIAARMNYLALDRALPPLRRGDVVAVFGSGAYGMSMASHYNSMPLPAEILVDGNRHTVIRRRETAEDLYRNELLPEAAAT